MATALVVDEDAAYPAQGGMYEMTQTPQGRLKVDTAGSGTTSVTETTLAAATPTNLLAPGDRRLLQIYNTGSNSAVIFMVAAANQSGATGIPLAAGGVFNLGFAPTNAISAVSASGTNLVVISG